MMTRKKTMSRAKSMIGESITDEIGKFWVLTKPSSGSTLDDILFEADIMYMKNQFEGGLEGSQIVGFYKNETKAKKKAEKLIG